MNLLTCWPIPEAFACIIIGGIAGGIAPTMPASILVGAVVGIGIADISKQLRDKYGTEC